MAGVEIKRRPNWDRFISIVSLALAVLFFALQENGVDISWQLSVAVYLTAAAGFGWSIQRHAIPHLERKRKWIITVVAPIAFLCAGGIGTVKQYRRDHKIEMTAPSTALTAPPATGTNQFAYKNLKDVFDEGVPGNVNVKPALPQKYTNPRTKKSTRVFSLVSVDPKTQVYVLLFYISRSDDTLAICRDLSTEKLLRSPLPSLKPFDSGDFWEGPVPDSISTVRHPIFSRRVIIYHETDLPLFERGDIDRIFHSKNLSVELRGESYVITKGEFFPVPATKQP